jgi:hypothetical protein
MWCGSHIEKRHTSNHTFRILALQYFSMANTYTAITKQDGDWWIGWIEEIPGVNCQEKTLEELRESLRVTLKEALEYN